MPPLLLLLLSVIAVSDGATNWQNINAPAQFTNATQFGIGIAATPTYDAGLIVGYNYTDGRGFAQFYEQNSSGLWQETDAVMYGAVMTGFDTTEMNPAGALVSTDKLTRVWSISTVNDSLISYGFVYVWWRPNSSTPATQTQVLTDPLPGSNRIYGGALWGTPDARIIVVGSPVFPVSGPSNTVPSIVEVWVAASSPTIGTYNLEHTISVIETRTGLFGYSGDITDDGRWLAVGSWNGQPRSIFLYDRSNSYTLAATLSPFGNITRFSYSMRFSPDGQWLIVGVFQYPSPGFVGAVLAYEFNRTSDSWITDSYYFLSTGAPYTSSPGQGASVGVSNNYTLNGTTAWSLVYGMPYFEGTPNNTASASVWTFTTSKNNWTEILPPPLEIFGNFSSSNSPIVDNRTRWSNFNTSVSSSIPFFDLGWPFAARNMISYDGCSSIIAGIGNVGFFTGTVFYWTNVTGDCPRQSAPVAPPVASPVTPPPQVEPPSSPPVITPNAIVTVSVLAPIAGILVLVLITVLACSKSSSFSPTPLPSAARQHLLLDDNAMNSRL